MVHREFYCFFEMRFYDPVIPLRSCWVQSVYITTLLLGRASLLSSWQYCALFSPDTDNCPKVSWISGRERMTVENISWSISMKECCCLGGDWIRDLLVSSRTAHPTEPPRPATLKLNEYIWSISTKECCQPSRGQPSNLLITRRTPIQLSLRGRTGSFTRP